MAERSGAVLLDLDGTFADTAPDLGHALNRLLAERGRPALPFPLIRPHASHGSQGLIRLGFGLGPGDEGYETLRLRYLEIYAANLTRATLPFPGMLDLVERLEERATPWGIVTNKPAWLTGPLMETLGLSERAACIVSGDTTAHAKPHPAPLLHACRLIGREPGDCWYVGDSERDVAAGLAAGTGTLVALFGYLGSEDNPTAWGADGMVREPLEILRWLGPPDE